MNLGRDAYNQPQDLSPVSSPHMVYLLIDCSTSMEGEPLQQAKRGALRFADEARRKGYRVGLIRFADEAQALRNPQTGFNEAIADLTAYGTTNLTDALELGTYHLVDEAVGQRVLCVITDGMPDHPRRALKAARTASRNQIQIMAIGTAEADLKFLDKLVTTKSLASYVSASSLDTGISDMARLLPPPK